MKRQSKFWPILILLLAIMPLASATISDFGEYRQGMSINLIQVCSNCTWINISSVLAPDSSLILSNVIMTEKGYTFNYTLDSSKTQKLGTYQVTGVGDENGIPSEWSYTFEVTSLGNSDQTNSTTYFILFGLTFIILIIGIITKEKAMTILGGFAVAFMGLYTLNNGFVGYRNVATQWISIIIMIFGALWAVLAAMSYLEEDK